MRRGHATTPRSMRRPLHTPRPHTTSLCQWQPLRQYGRKGGAMNRCCPVIEGDDWGGRVVNELSRVDLGRTRCPPSQCLYTWTCPPRAHPYRPVLLSMRPSASPPSTRTPVYSAWPFRCPSTAVTFRAHVLPTVRCPYLCEACPLCTAEEAAPRSLRGSRDTGHGHTLKKGRAIHWWYGL